MSKITSQFKFKIEEALFVTNNAHCTYAAISNGVAAIIKARVLNLDTNELCYVYEDTTHEKHVGGYDNMLVTNTVEYVEKKYSTMANFPTDFPTDE